MSFTVTFLQAHELMAEANLVLQTVVLLLIVLAIFLQRRKKFVWHGNVMLVGAIITALILIMHMGPTFVRISEGLVTFDAVALVGVAHGIIGAIALFLGLWLSVVWAYLDSDMRFCTKNRKWMLRILTLWLIALGMGYVYYVIHIVWS